MKLVTKGNVDNFIYLLANTHIDDERDVYTESACCRLDSLWGVYWGITKGVVRIEG